MFQELGEKIWFIQGKLGGRYPYSNALYIDDKQKVLIDTGVGRSVIKKVLRQFGQPDMILYTHGHEDHITNTGLFTGSRFIHERDKYMAQSKEENYRVLGMDTDELIDIHNSFLKAFNYQPLDVVETFREGKIFDVGTYQVKVLHTPGHSAGHCSFELPTCDLIFTGDIDLKGGPWYGGTDSDIHAYTHWINQLIEKAPKILVSSHTAVISEHIPSTLAKFSSRIKKRDDRILNFLREEHSMPEIITEALIQGKFFKPLTMKTPRVYVAERMMLGKHLDLLLAAKKIEEREGKYRSL